MSMNAELVWSKSSYSGSEGDSCVEWARDAVAVYVRDSKDVALPRVEVSTRAWAAFVAHAVRG
ncbi:DUF397 domain-containing protein [Streptomyces sp. Z26]|uniref:DUF397 domain-containing protein n=1 Tax=Streptomyces sp. Z26 TaxID=2500177 RepID=UPI000EF14710|nr:DUF397 domain-containing protein [Streptomyces sp. Z26]RLL66004.1 DUF397 domain-containing protein [Streptomyces sp. Z26]